MQQIFTKEVMLVLATLTFVYLLGVIVVLLRWRDTDVLWTIAIEAMVAIFVFYFADLVVTETAVLPTFPLVGLVSRPAQAGTWLIICAYTLYRLHLKNLARQV